MTYQWPSFYDEWSQKRLNTLRWHYGQKWFRDKKILELACGHGRIGLELARWGARVTMTDGNPEFVAEVRNHLSEGHIIAHEYDCNDPWPGQWPIDRFDMIINFGLLYHVEDPELLLENCIDSCHRMVLETKILASGQVFPEVYTEDGTADGAKNHRGAKISTEWVERTLRLLHTNSYRINPNADVDKHIHYEWYEEPGVRRAPDRAFWLISTGETPITP